MYSVIAISLNKQSKIKRESKHFVANICLFVTKCVLSPLMIGFYAHATCIYCPTMTNIFSCPVRDGQGMHECHELFLLQ